MSRGKRRKLIRYDKFLELYETTAIGVPLARALRDMQLDISRPLAAKMLKVYEGVENETMESSAAVKVVDTLRPTWMNVHKGASNVQEQPDGWDYEGYFPFGDWVEKSE
jgi:hypothetical protein